MYQYYNNIMCVEAQVIYGALSLMTYDAYKKHCIRKTLLKVRNACPGQKALLGYEALPHDYKEIIKETYGDPYVVAKRNAIQDLITTDLEAINFYRDYIYDGDKTLSEERQREYVTNAQILKVLGALASDRQAFCKKLGGRAVRVWETLSNTLNGLNVVIYPHSLPSNARSLERAHRRFVNEGYYGLIHKNYGNQNTEKLTDESKMWIVSRWANQVKRMPNIEQLLFEYNSLAMERGWKPLKEADTLHNFLYRPDIKSMWYGHRHGEIKAKEKFAFQHSTKMPTMRDSLWYSDGTKLNYYYLTNDGKVGTINVYEVIDAYSEVLLGYHIAEKENYATQYCAYKMAIQLSGYKPYEIGFDNQGGHKKLQSGSFLDKIAHLTIKKQPYNGKSKTIELAFSNYQQQYLKKDWFFTGQNIQAKKLESKANMEFINANKQNLPSLEEIKKIYAQRREEWNNAPHHATGIPRMQMYLESENPATHKVELWDMVDLFWIERAEPVTYTAYGLTFTEKKVKNTYTVYDENNLPSMQWHWKNVDRKFIVKFDPEDLTMIYLYDRDASGNLRFVKEARLKVEVSRGKQEQTDFDTDYIAKIQKMNKEARVETVDMMDAILKEHNMHASDYGLNSPKILGINSKRKKAKKVPTDFGELLKQESEMVPVINTQDNDDYNPFNNM